jgi:hypothetical protein
MDSWSTKAEKQVREDEPEGTQEDPNAQLRGETTAQRLDRNYGEILQELRVVQTGVQILFAFLLSLAFYERFAHLTSTQRNFYFATLMVAVLASALLIAPVAHHRMLFGQRRKDALVAASNRLAIVGLCFVMLALAGSIFLITDVLYQSGAAVAVTCAVIAVFVGLWFVMPRLYRDQ